MTSVAGWSDEPVHSPIPESAEVLLDLERSPDGQPKCCGVFGVSRHRVDILRRREATDAETGRMSPALESRTGHGRNEQSGELDPGGRDGRELAISSGEPPRDAWNNNRMRSRRPRAGVRTYPWVGSEKRLLDGI